MTLLKPFLFKLLRNLRNIFTIFFLYYISISLCLIIVLVINCILIYFGFDSVLQHDSTFERVAFHLYLLGDISSNFCGIFSIPTCLLLCMFMSGFVSGLYRRYGVLRQLIYIFILFLLMIFLSLIANYFLISMET